MHGAGSNSTNSTSKKTAKSGAREAAAGVGMSLMLLVGTAMMLM